MSVGSKIRALRKEQGYTLEKLAAKLRLTPAFLSNVERDKKNPSISTLKRISLALNTSVSYLLEIKAQNAVGNKLRLLRSAEGLTVEELSDSCGLPAEQIQAFEEGTLHPQMQEIERLAKALNYCINFFLEDSGSSPSIGTRLKQLRRKHGLTVKKVAYRAGVSPATIVMIENDKLVPQMEVLDRIAACFNKTNTYFFMDLQDTETLFFSLSEQAKELLAEPGVQSVLRAVKDFDSEELRQVLDRIYKVQKSARHQKKRQQEARVEL
jgi:transcriptional regulator with XRE-family HTH domain